MESTGEEAQAEAEEGDCEAAEMRGVVGNTAGSLVTR